MKKYISLGFILICFFAYWQVSMGVYKCDGDCPGYVILMDKSIFSLEYWRTFFSMYRPFTIPVIYSFFGSFTSTHQQWIVYFQTLLAFTAWLTFAYSFSNLVKTKPFNTLIFVIIMLTMFGRYFYFYNHDLLSDSIALSLLLLWYSLIIHLEKIVMRSKRKWITFSLFAFFTLVVACTRDTNTFMLLFAIPIVFKMKIARYEKLLLTTLILYISVACQFNASHRNTTNMVNVLTGVVLSDPAKRDFFITKGMPVDEALLKDPDVIREWDFRHMRFSQIHRANEKVEEALRPFLIRIKGVYAEYLLLHPQYVLQNIAKNYLILFNPSPSDLNQPLSLIDDIPLNWLMALMLLSLVFLIIHPVKKEKLFLFYSVIFLLAGFSNAVIAFHGDFWELSEMKRHCFIGSIFFKMGCMGIIMGAFMNVVALRITKKSSLLWKRRAREDL